MTDPEPAVVQIGRASCRETADVADKLQVGENREQTVVRAVSVNVTVPAGALVVVVVSATVYVMISRLQFRRVLFRYLTFPTLVDVLSFDETVTVTVAAELVLVL